MKKSKMKFLDLFAGIGGFRLGMEMAGHECVGYVEWDKFARKSYEAMHNTEGEWTAHDITTVTDDDIRRLGRERGPIHVICGGFPCQAFSVAGKRKGFDDTRGTLFFEIARFANILRPRYLFLENVKGLLNHNKGDTFETILRALDELGYDAEWDVLNSKDFGVPQNRERLFIVGHLREECGRKVFPIRGTHETPGINVIGTTKNKNAAGTNCRHWVHDVNGSVGALSATDYKQPKQIIQTAQNRHGMAIQQEPFNTTSAGDAFAINTGTHRYYFPSNVKRGEATLIKQTQPNFRIRKLTPRECWRLQGFPNQLFDKAAEVNSDSQLYKQAGNSVTVNVIYEIAKRL